MDEQTELPQVLQSLGKDVEIVVLVGQYQGYAKAINAVCKEVLSRDPAADWLVVQNDDTELDPTYSPQQIAERLSAYFGGTWGMAQATGDPWAGGSINDIAGSPYLGREWCERAHAGQGPFCPLFWHMEVDVAALWAAEREGVYLRCPWLNHRHDHFCRSGEEVSWNNPVPKHLEFVNGGQHKAEATRFLQEFKQSYEAQWRPLRKVERQ